MIFLSKSSFIRIYLVNIYDHIQMFQLNGWLLNILFGIEVLTLDGATITYKLCVTNI